MKTTLLRPPFLATVAAISLSSMIGLALAQDQTRDQTKDQLKDQDRTQQQDKTQQQDRDRDQVRDQDRIYGRELMTQRERGEYRQQMRSMKTAEEREAFRLQHHNEMQERARAKGKKLPDEPPSRGDMRGMGGMGGMSGMGGGGGGR